MMITVLVLIIGVYKVWDILTKKYVNPYTLTFIFGRKGCGKSTHIAKQALRYQRKGYKVYVSSKDCKVPGVYLFDAYTDVGKYHFDRNSVVLIDEAGIIWPDRNHKTFPDYVMEWFKLQRHYQLILYIYSQEFDVDKKIRCLCDSMFQLRMVARIFSVGRRIKKKQVIVKASPEAPSRIDMDLVPDRFYMAPFGGRIMTFIPKYVKYNDTYAAPELPYKEYVRVPDLPEVEKISLTDRLRKWLEVIKKKNPPKM